MFTNVTEGIINFRIVYFGLRLSGKGTSLRTLWESFPAEQKTPMEHIPPAKDGLPGVMFFDFEPLGANRLHGKRVRVNVRGLTGVADPHPFWPRFLENVDGIVFVVDSQIERIFAHQDALDKLREYLVAQGRDPQTVPMVFQLNKRDLSNAGSVEELKTELNVGVRFCGEATGSDSEAVTQVAVQALRAVMTAFHNGALIEFRAPSVG
jgi:GTPase SAR1 family protein